MGSGIGVVAICRNEERDLPAFLDHLLSWVEEIVLVDDGSTDGTLAIARAAGDKVRVLSRPMGEAKDFAAQRNAGLAEASAPWLLHMDIDERVSTRLRSELLDVAGQNRWDAARYRRLNLFLHRPMKGGGWNGWNKVQFARRSVLRFENALHESAVLADGARVCQLHGVMVHLNDDGYDERRHKSMLYTSLTARALVESGKRVRWRHLLWEPTRAAAARYLWHGGFRDGVPGLIWALHTWSAIFQQYALAWDAQNRIDRDDAAARAMALSGDAGGDARAVAVPVRDGATG